MWKTSFSTALVIWITGLLLLSRHRRPPTMTRAIELFQMSVQKLCAETKLQPTAARRWRTSTPLLPICLVMVQLQNQKGLTNFYRRIKCLRRWQAEIFQLSSCVLSAWTGRKIPAYTPVGIHVCVTRVEWLFQTAPFAVVLSKDLIVHTSEHFFFLNCRRPDTGYSGIDGWWLRDGTLATDALHEPLQTTTCI